MEKDDIAVSVWCIAYNHEKYIRQTLEGFCMQKTNFRYEVFVHDDASTDSTAEIIREYAAKRPDIFRPIFQTENQYSKGVRITREIIRPQTRGKYIAYCEGDDYWTDEYKLQKQFEAMEAHPECSLCTHTVTCCNEDGTPNERVIPEAVYNIVETGILDEDELAKRYWGDKRYPFHTSSYFYRKDIPRYSVMPRDKGILRRCLACGKCYYISQPMSVYRLFSINSWSSRMAAQGKEGRFEPLLSDIKHEIKFNEETNGRFASYIKAHYFMRLMSFADLKSVEVGAAMREFKLTPKDIAGTVPTDRYIKLAMRYALLQLTPKHYPQIMAWRKKVGSVFHRPPN